MKTGNWLIVISIITTLILYLFSKFQNPSPINFFTFLTQTTGLVGSILISWNYFLSTRTTFIEKLFNGLDKVYKTHNIIGNIAFILVINHPIFLILNSLPINTTKLYLIPTLSNLPYTFGILSLYSLIILVSLTIFVDLPYKIWKKTHEVMGLVIIFGSLHSLLISSDISIFLPLKIWVLTFNVVAIFAFLYKRYFYYYLKPKSNYKITDIKHEKNYILLEMSSVDLNKFIKFNSGQFATYFLPNNCQQTIQTCDQCYIQANHYHD